MATKPENTGAVSTMSVPTDGLVDEWKLNGDATDTSGNGFNGSAGNMSYMSTVYGDGIWGFPPYVGLFNGWNSYIKSDVGAGYNSFSVSLWFNMTSPLNNANLFSYG